MNIHSFLLLMERCWRLNRQQEKQQQQEQQPKNIWNEEYHLAAIHRMLKRYNNIIYAYNMNINEYLPT